MVGNWWNPIRLLRRRKKKPRANDSPYAWPNRWKARLELTVLEKRSLFSASPIVQKPPFWLGGAAGFGQDLWNAPVSGELPPVDVTGSGEVTYAGGMGGTYQFDQTGTYTFAIHVVGGDSFHCITFDETGTVTYTSAYNDAGSSGTNYAVASWAFDRTDFFYFGGQTFTSHYTPSGHDTWSFGGPAADNFKWNGMVWTNLVEYVDTAHSLNLYHYPWTSVSVDEDGGYTFSYTESGTTSVTMSDPTYFVGDANSRPAGMPALFRPGAPAPDAFTTSAISYSFAGLGTYTYSEVGADSFTLHENGTYNPAASDYSLSSVLYNDLGHATYVLAESGLATATGAGTALTTALFGSGATSGGATQLVSFTYATSAAVHYDETGVMTQTLRFAGNYGGHSTSFSSVVIDQAATVTSLFANTGSSSYSGTALATSTWGGGPANANSFGFKDFNSASTLSGSSTDSYSFSGTDSYTFGAAANASVDFYRAGSYAGVSNGAGTYAFGSVAYSGEGQNTVSYQDLNVASFSAAGSYTFSGTEAGTGSGANGGTTGNGTVSTASTYAGSYSLSGVTTTTVSRAAGNTFDLSAQGAYANASYNLSSVVLNNTSRTTVSDQVDSQLSYSGAANGSYSGSSTGSNTTNFAGTTGSGLGTASYSGHDSIAYSGTLSASYLYQGAQTLGLYAAGNYANGSYSFGSVVLTESAANTYTVQFTGVQSASGAGAASSTMTDAGTG